MKRQSAKQKVQAIFPDAIVVEDTNTDYPSDWASQCSFAIGYFDASAKIGVSTLKISYYALIAKPDWNFLSSWNPTKHAAWKMAWESIENQMMKKLEQ